MQRAAHATRTQAPAPAPVAEDDYGYGYGSNLPEFYITEDGQRVGSPTYELLGDCHMVMQSAETGQTGPTLVLAGEHITTEETPNHQWKPLNRAADIRVQQWIDSLPASGRGLTHEEISEAAVAMRPKAGEKEIPHDLWWAAVIKYATTMKERRSGRAALTGPAIGYRPNPGAAPVMSNAATSSVTPMAGAAPAPNTAQHLPQNPHIVAARQRRGAVAPSMPGTQGGRSPQG